MEGGSLQKHPQNNRPKCNVDLIKLVTNLICIGDSNIEMEAAHSLSKEF